LGLHYSVPFNYKKYKEASEYDVKPLVLPTINTDEYDGDDEEDKEEQHERVPGESEKYCSKWVNV